MTYVKQAQSMPIFLCVESALPNAARVEGRGDNNNSHHLVGNITMPGKALGHLGAL